MICNTSTTEDEQQYVTLSGEGPPRYLIAYVMCAPCELTTKVLTSAMNRPPTYKELARTIVCRTSTS